MAVRRCLMLAGELHNLMLQDPQGNRGLNQLQLLHLVVSSLMHLLTKTTQYNSSKTDTNMGYAQSTIQSTTNAQIHRRRRRIDP